MRDFRLGKCDENKANASRNAYLIAVKKASTDDWNKVMDETSPPNL